jgi:hypothetical protein
MAVVFASELATGAERARLLFSVERPMTHQDTQLLGLGTRLRGRCLGLHGRGGANNEKEQQNADLLHD